MTSNEQAPFFDRLVSEFAAVLESRNRDNLKDFIESATLEQRRTVLLDLIELDLEYKWKQRGTRASRSNDPTADEVLPTLTRYVDVFPELGTLDQLPSALWLADVVARGKWDNEFSIDEYITGYQIEDEQLIEELKRSAKLNRAAAIPDLPGYDDIAPIGQGGMGVVYKATHRRMKRQVAIKLIPPGDSDSESRRKRFEREMQAAAALKHPNVVTAFHADEINGSLVLISEYVEGSDLASFVKSNGPLSVERTIEIIQQVAEGLAFSHSHHIIHRDIKPSNLILDESEGRVRILDFGLARMNGADSETERTVPDLTTSGVVMGTVDYMSPEQAKDSKSVDNRSDLYSLGCVLHFLLTAKPPYSGDTMMNRLLAHRDQPIPSLRAQVDDVPQWLDDIFKKLMAKNSEDRFGSAEEVLNKISRHAREADRDTANVTAGWRSLPYALIGMAAIAGLALVMYWPNQSSETNSTSSLRNESDTDVSMALPGLSAERSLHTVSLDGSADFSSISAALASVEPGAMIRVLDSGPYHENLMLHDVNDVAIVSDVGTTVTNTEWRRFPDTTILKGHAFNRVDGLSLSGLVFLADSSVEHGDLVSVTESNDVAISNCAFVVTDVKDFCSALSLSVWTDAQVSECVFQSRLLIYARASSTLVASENWFVESATKQLSLNFVSGDATQDESCRVELGHNVFGRCEDISIHINQNTASPRNVVDIHHNTFSGASHGSIGIFSDALDHPMTFRRNLFLGSHRAVRDFHVSFVPEEAEIAAQHWIAENNAFESPPRVFSPVFNANNSIFDEIVVESTSRQDPNYLRPVSHKDIGALTPLAEGEADWFSRLHERALRLVPDLATD